MNAFPQNSPILIEQAILLVTINVIESCVPVHGCFREKPIATFRGRELSTISFSLLARQAVSYLLYCLLFDFDSNGIQMYFIDISIHVIVLKQFHVSNGFHKQRLDTIILVKL